MLLNRVGKTERKKGTNLGSHYFCQRSQMESQARENLTHRNPSVRIASLAVLMLSETNMDLVFDHLGKEKSADVHDAILRYFKELFVFKPYRSSEQGKQYIAKLTDSKWPEHIQKLARLLSDPNFGYAEAPCNAPYPKFFKTVIRKNTTAFATPDNDTQEAAQEPANTEKPAESPLVFEPIDDALDIYINSPKPMIPKFTVKEISAREYLALIEKKITLAETKSCDPEPAKDIKPAPPSREHRGLDFGPDPEEDVADTCRIDDGTVCFSSELIKKIFNSSNSNYCPYTLDENSSDQNAYLFWACKSNCHKTRYAVFSQIKEMLIHKVPYILPTEPQTLYKLASTEDFDPAPLFERMISSNNALLRAEGYKNAIRAYHAQQSEASLLSLIERASKDSAPNVVSDGMMACQGLSEGNGMYYWNLMNEKDGLCYDGTMDCNCRVSLQGRELERKCYPYFLNSTDPFVMKVSQEMKIIYEDGTYFY